jgi:glycosyltransferase involved in cell wall biosynthesis
MAKPIRSVFIGNFAKAENGDVYSLKNYARFYNELSENTNFEKLTVFGGYINHGETGFDFSFEEPLNGQIHLTLSKGNTPDTPLLSFAWNNFKLFARLTLFCLKKDNYFIFLPSPLGVFSILIISFFKRKKSLGIYIGGHYGAEQAFEKRKGFVKKKIKKAAAVIVDKAVDYSIKKSDYIITSSYRYYHLHSADKKMFLTPPLINVTEEDLNCSFPKKRDRTVTFCGELRHAKGVMDLLEAFARLIKEERITNCKLKIIGSGQAHDEMVQAAKQTGIDGFVTFLGQVKDRDLLKEEIGTSSVFVLPSYSEGFPRVAYEAFTLGVPAILTPVGGIPFFVKHNTHCILIEPGNIDDLATAIETLLNDENLSCHLVFNAKELMKESVFPRIKANQSLACMVTEKVYKTA